MTMSAWMSHCAKVLSLLIFVLTVVLAANANDAVVALEIDSTSSQQSAPLAVCAGEGPRYGDYKCNHDGTHRVCAHLKTGAGAKVLWGQQDFWHLTGQSDWSSQVGSDPQNPGGGWCICMWATASLISKTGCDNVHIDCAATDIQYVLDRYQDGGHDLSPAKDCLSRKCPAKLKQLELGASDRTVMKKSGWSGTEIQDLHAQYDHIFKSRNRNAASHLWTSFLMKHAAGMPADRFQKLSAGYCAVSGSPVTPMPQTRYLSQLSAVGGGLVTGFMSHCCWPCFCDVRKWVKADTMTVQTADGRKPYTVAVIGNPCDHPEKLQVPFADPFGHGNKTLQTEAPEVQCDGGKLVGAQLSDNGFVVLGLLDTWSSQGTASKDEAALTEQCEEREASGFNSGMGLIFIKVAMISPISGLVPQQLGESTVKGTELQQLDTEHAKPKQVVPSEPSASEARREPTIHKKRQVKQVEQYEDSIFSGVVLTLMSVGGAAIAFAYLVKMHKQKALPL